jgi:hypothetical protein
MLLQKNISAYNQYTPLPVCNRKTVYLLHTRKGVKLCRLPDQCIGKIEINILFPHILFCTLR